MKNKYRWLILALTAIIFIFSGIKFFDCGEGEQTVRAIPKESKIPKPQRIIIRFKEGATKKDKKDFFDKLGAKIIAQDVFGFDIAEWASPEKPITKGIINSAYTLEVKQRITIDKYEIEGLAYRKLLPKSGCIPSRPETKIRDKLIVPWYERFIENEKAHAFLENAKVSLEPNGIVIIDDGPQMTHKDIEPVIKKNELGHAIYWINEHNRIKKFMSDHGTHVGCLAAGYRDKNGIDGIAYKKSYLLPLLINYNDTGAFFVSDIAIGLKYFRTLELLGRIRFRVVNMSFHISWPSIIIYQVMKELDDKIFVIAAGNENLDLDIAKTYPPSWDLPNKIVVGATREDEHLAYFSNYGLNSVDIVAPGKNITSCALGDRYMKMSGTSMASPITAGAVSLLFSMDMNASVNRIKQALFMGAVSVRFLERKIKYARRLNVNLAVRNFDVILHN
ncbi:MAG: hypothetical protein COU51_04335 [Parcubacteria group bacterium CG10_big_fil_rev_8_21_14_0_10_36_14]|nr:MAG: hypothetical protein COU51_04335 [Parcubacteria group bacterium CG10_big_fil_rev_8_21_14_0_10_36_14]